jgi:hypothetical protein
MSSFALIPHREYSVAAFQWALYLDNLEAKKFQFGTTLIITAMLESQLKKVEFVFQGWYQQWDGDFHTIGISGARKGGKGLIGVSSERLGYIGEPRFAPPHLDGPIDVVVFGDNLFPDKIITPKAITYINDNFISSILENTPKRITELIRQYLYNDELI